MDSKVEMLSQQEIEKIATKINKNIDIPFMGENREQTVIVKIDLLHNSQTLNEFR